MICASCKTHNPVGSKFCRECGTKLAAAANDTLQAEETARVEAERAREKAALLTADALMLAEKNEPDKAIPLAQEAAELAPDSTAPHALLATLYERTEQQQQAIEAQEQVVALNPDSAADKEKLDQLRRGVHVLPRTVGAAAPTLKRVAAWIPLAAAFGVATLVLAAGLSLVRRVDVAARPAPASSSAASPAAPFVPAAPAPATPSASRKDPFAPLDNGVPAAPVTTPTAAAPTAATRPAAATLPPLLGGDRAARTATVAPPRRFTPPAPARPASATNRNNKGASQRIAVQPPPARGGNSETPAGGSYIRISVSPPPPPASLAGAATAAAPASAPSPPDTDPLTRAQSLQAAGRYREAIAAYRQALGTIGGLAAGDAQQGVALCYQRAGDEAAAREAYREAITTYEAQIAGGRDIGAAQRGLASCRAALETLGG